MLRSLEELSIMNTSALAVNNPFIVQEVCFKLFLNHLNLILLKSFQKLKLKLKKIKIGKK